MCAYCKGVIMPVERAMMEAGRVSYFRLTDPWTLDEIVEAEDNGVFLKRVRAAVHTIVDVTGSQTLPTGVVRLYDVPTAPLKLPGYNVLVGASFRIKAIGRLFSHVTGNHKLIYVDTLDEAWAFISHKMADIERAVAI